MPSDVKDSGATLVKACHGAAKAGGWHNDIKTGLPRTSEEDAVLFPTRIALVHSELSEALEGQRKGMQDEKLPHRLAAEVELADAVIRICDLSGIMGYDLGGAIEEKLAYNQQRLDHTLEHRRSAGGKTY